MKPSSVSWLMGLVLASGCHETPAPKIPDRPIRLVDQLPEAIVESPLSSIAVAQTLDDLGPDIRHHEVWRAPLDEQRSESDCEWIADSEEPPFLHCPSGNIFFTVQVQPSTRYRVRLRAFRQRLCFRARVEERSETFNRLWTWNFPKPIARNWEDLEVQFMTSPTTRVLRIFFGNCDTRVSELRVDELDLEHEQELALLKGKDRAPGAQDPHGILKRGLLLPLANPEATTAPADDNYIVRDVLFAPAPTDLTFDLRVPRNARLSFSYALSAASRLGDSAELRVVVQPRRDAEREVWRGELTLGSDGESWHWHDQTLDLAEFGGQQIQLTLSTRSKSPRAYVLWGHPVIDAPSMARGGPNIILITVDTLRADRLSSYGYSSPTSPQIDALARNGTLFDQTVSPFNYTVPSFSSLLTGHGAVDSPRFIPADRPTLASIFREAGWATGAIMYKPALYTGGFDQGFDEFFNVPRLNIRAEDNIGKALAWLNRHRDRRFFLLLHLNDPHQPFCQPSEGVPEALHDRLADFGLALPIKIRDSWSGGQTVRGAALQGASATQDCEDCSTSESFHTVAQDLYDDAITYADEQIGVFLQALKDEGLYDDAVIALVSDHGEALWTRDQWFTHQIPSLYDEQTRVPLIVKPPAGAGWGRGRVVRSQVRHFDLMPTLLELANLDSATPAVDGRSLVPMLRSGETEQGADRPAILLQTRHQLGGVRRDGWKYLTSFRAPKWEQLFHLSEDPGELHDVAADHPELVAAAREDFLEALLSARSGETLLVTGAPPAESYSIEVTWDRKVSLLPFTYPVAGKVFWSEDGPLNVHFTGATHGRILLLARFEIPEDETVRMHVTLVTEGQPPKVLAENLEVERGIPYARGMMARVSQEPDVKAVIFRSSSRAAEAPEEKKLDERQMDALRALGYIQ